MQHVQGRGRDVMQCETPLSWLSAPLMGDPAPDSQLIIQPGRIFRSFSPQRGVHCPQVAVSLITNRGPLVGRWAQALGAGHIMTAVTDPQIATVRHNNVSIGAQNGNVAPNIDIVLHSGVEFLTDLDTRPK